MDSLDINLNKPGSEVKDPDRERSGSMVECLTRE